MIYRYMGGQWFMAEWKNWSVIFSNLLKTVGTKQPDAEFLFFESGSMEFDSHWEPNSCGLVLHLSKKKKKLSKLPLSKNRNSASISTHRQVHTADDLKLLSMVPTKVPWPWLEQPITTTHTPYWDLLTMPAFGKRIKENGLVEKQLRPFFPCS